MSRARSIETGAMLLPSWLEIVESDDGQYRIMDSSFDDGPMQLACFSDAQWAKRFAARLAECRTDHEFHNQPGEEPGA